MDARVKADVEIRVSSIRSGRPLLPIGAVDQSRRTWSVTFFVMRRLTMISVHVPLFKRELMMVSVTEVPWAWPVPTVVPERVKRALDARGAFMPLITKASRHDVPVRWRFKPAPAYVARQFVSLSLVRIVVCRPVRYW